MNTTAATPLADRTLIMSGGSRGIGLAIAKRVAADGANITLIAKTDIPHPKLPGTIHTAAAELEEAGAKVLKFVGDVRVDEHVAEAVAQSIERFGGIDMVVNNASAINLARTEAISMKSYDLMQDINCRGSFLLSKLCLPALRESSKAGRNPHILTLSPPLNLNPRWPGRMLAYTIAKYGMSLTTLGLAEELKDDGIGVNSLWPHTTIATAALQIHQAGEAMAAKSRTAEIMADAAYLILTSQAASTSGNFFLDDEVLTKHGAIDFDKYAVTPGNSELELDLYLES
ncbi:citronellol/citronellal dehydrogenase [Mycobacterium sp. MAA66]|uniref:SDR family oxidoreductase n=1 Tax=Mycobacterium sp. MAA66 TaxID=3156297 RepID=UPI0035199AD9